MQMSKKKKAIAMAAALGMIFCTGAAQAVRVGYIETEADLAYHAQHLEEKHFRDGVCRNTGNNVMLRTSPGVKKNVGKIAVSQAVRILETYDSWAKVIVLSNSTDNAAADLGMVGWIGVEYIDCGCDEEAYYAESTPAEAAAE